MRTISVSYFLSMYDVCLKFGGSEKTLLALVPGGKTTLKVRDARLPYRCLFDLLDVTEQETGLKNIGLLAGQNVRPESFRETGQAIMFCRSLREAALINNKYQSLAQQFGQSRVRVEGDLAYLQWYPYSNDIEYMRKITDAVVASHAQFTRWLTWQHDLEFRAIYFRHPKPTYAEEYSKFFRCPVIFRHEFDAICHDAAIVDKPLQQANPDLLARVCKTLDLQIENLAKPQSAAILVSTHLENRLENGPPSLAILAKELNMSVRSLSRRLEDEDTSYRVILENTRRTLCEQYILDGRWSLPQISAKLGYSEQSAFNRAFKRWHGTTPKAYIRAMQVFQTAFDQMAP